MLIVLIIFIILPSIFTFAVSHISANKLQYLRYQIKQVSKNSKLSYFVYITKEKKISRQCNKTEALRLSSEDESSKKKKKKGKVCIHVRPSLKHHITS
jgi:biopolymer transport protein ExbD